jgi:hypothetical protein
MAAEAKAVAPVESKPASVVPATIAASAAIVGAKEAPEEAKPDVAPEVAPVESKPVEEVAEKPVEVPASAKVVEKEPVVEEVMAPAAVVEEEPKEAPKEPAAEVVSKEAVVEEEKPAAVEVAPPVEPAVAPVEPAVAEPKKEETAAPKETEATADEPAKVESEAMKPVDEPKAPREYAKPASFESVQYPEGVEAPARVEGILRYERSFLLRFKDAKEKWERPEGLPTNDVIYDDSGAARPGSASVGGRRPGVAAGLPSRPTGGMPSRGPSTPVGQALKTSEERYAAARASVQSGNFLSSFGPRPGGLNSGLGPRAQSSGGNAGNAGGRAQSTAGRAQATGGRQRGGGDKGGRQGSQGGRSRKDMEMEAQFTIPIDQIKPLTESASAWAPPTMKKKGPDEEEDKIRRKLQGLLNKLSLEKFESISNQIMGLGIDNESILALVIAGIFDKAVDEPNFGSMYAGLCAKLSAELPKARPWMLDEKDPTKNNLFRRLLLTKCQVEFEKGAKWSEIGKDREAKDIADMTLEEKQKLVEDEEKRQKMKRQALGNIRFIGEVFNLGMLGEKIMHACISQLLQDGTKNHGEEELESVCKLMATIGQKLDHAKAKAHMDEYFKVIKKLTTNQNLSSRIRFALQDIVDLRERNNWKARGNQAAGPKTIAEIRQAVSSARLELLYFIC